MKTLRSRVLSVAFALLAVVAFAGSSQDFEKKIVKQYAISADGEVEIVNKYGKVELQTWDDNQVKIEVTIIVDAKSKSKADEVFDRISVDFTNTSSVVRAATEISSGKVWDSWFGSSSSKFEINYQVWVPSSIDIDLSNKYGDIIVASMGGDASIDLKYGNFRIDDIAGDVRIDLGYGKGSITSGAKLDLALQYSTLHGGDFSDVTADTKYSTLELGNVDVLQTSSSYDAYRVRKATMVSNVGKYDDFALGAVESITMTTKYTHLEMEELTGDAELNFTHGGVRVRTLANGFTKFELKGDYTNCTLGTAAGTQFNMDVSGRYTSVKHSNVEVYYDVQSTGQSTVRGFRGTKDGGGKIFAELSYATFKID